ncbi:MAG: hypothetical protein ABIK92_06705 [Pseudomonadota bacterium]
MKAKIDKMKTYIKKQADPILIHYEGKNADLDVLAANIEKWFKEKEFTTQKLQAETKWLVQATKQNLWRIITASTRAFSVRIDGSPDDFQIEIGEGKWINNTTSLAIITILSGAILLPFCGTATMWSKKISSDLKKYIDLTIDFV